MPTNKRRKTPRPSRSDKERYRLFVQAYLDLSNPKTYLNAKSSAMTAGYFLSYAHGRSYELLDRVGIQQEMKRVRDSRLKSSTIATPEEDLESLTMQMRTLPNELVDPVTGNFISLKDMTRDQAAAIADFKAKRRTYTPGDSDTPVTENTIEYRLVDRLGAAAQLARYYGLFEKDSRQKPAGGPNNILVAFLTTPISLEEWQRQAVAILANTQNTSTSPALPEPK